MKEEWASQKSILPQLGTKVKFTFAKLEGIGEIIELRSSSPSSFIAIVVFEGNKYLCSVKDNVAEGILKQ